jgi:hypothetical protein
MSSTPPENAPQTPITPDGHVQLPTTEALLAQANAMQSGSQPLPTYTPTGETAMASNPPRQAMPVSTTFDTAAQKALMHSMSRFVKAQGAFIHSEQLAPFASAMESHIIALTTALEQVGVL